MARSRQIKRSRKSKALSSFLPEALQVFVARRLVDVVALAVFCAGSFLVAALLSYQKSDPSWNTASDVVSGSVGNMGGENGAWLADIMLQTLGLAAFVPGVVLLVWAVRIFKRQSVRPVMLRSAALLLCCLFGAVAFVRAPALLDGFSYALDSAVGVLVLERLVPVLEGLKIPHAYMAVRLFFGFFAGAFLLYGAAVRGHEIAS
ncbi:MAG: DNA translocase FtsK 4TM domain-containing protein, partial [Alphaproteobacteria bacterium]